MSIEKARNVSDVSHETMKRLRLGRNRYSCGAMIYFNPGSIAQQRMFCFSGNNSPFTPTSKFQEPIQISGQLYNSITEYMWSMKFKELTNRPLPQKEQNVSYRQLLYNHFVTNARVETWMLERGLLHLQKAVLRHVQSNKDFYRDLCQTGDNLIVYTYSKDSFLASGSRFYDVQQWWQNCAENSMIYQMSKNFPLTANDIAHTPSILNGQNVLGLVYMAIREQLKFNDPYLMEIEIPALTMIPPAYPRQFEIKPRKRQPQRQFSFESTPRQFFPTPQNQFESTPIRQSQRQFFPTPQKAYSIRSGSVCSGHDDQIRHNYSYASVMTTPSTFNYANQFHQHRYSSATTRTVCSDLFTPSSSFCRLDINSVSEQQEMEHIRQEMQADHLNVAASQQLPSEPDDHVLEGSTKVHERLRDNLETFQEHWFKTGDTPQESMQTPEHCPSDDEEDLLLNGKVDEEIMNASLSDTALLEKYLL